MGRCQRYTFKLELEILKLKNLLLGGLILLTGVPIIAQNNARIKSITCYEDTVFRSISVLDSNGNIVFGKNNGAFGWSVETVIASYYDTLNQRIKNIFGHANVGFSI